MLLIVILDFLHNFLIPKCWIIRIRIYIYIYIMYIYIFIYLPIDTNLVELIKFNSLPVIHKYKSYKMHVYNMQYVGRCYSHTGTLPRLKIFLGIL